MTSAELRRATHADVPAIAEFQTRSWHETYRGLVPQDYLDRISADVRQARWHQRLDSGSRRIAVATIDEILVGVVSWAESDTPGIPPLELKSLYLDAAQHGSGLAAELTEFAIGEAPAFLWVFEENPRARAFYAKQGFGPDGTRKIDPDTGIWELRMVRVSSRAGTGPAR
jgi:GNAT superfamily N-acetyltransferase